MTRDEAEARAMVSLLEAENAELRDRLAAAERYTAQTLARATRLSQVIAVLASDADFDTVVERAAVEVGELFSSDVALLMLGPDDAVRVEGQYGIRAADLPADGFALAPLERLTANAPVRTGPAAEVGVPSWLEPYALQHVAWARLLVGEESLGVLLLGRLGPEPFEPFDDTELRAVAYRVARAMENGLLHRRMRAQARHDSLTGLLGHRVFHERLDELAAGDEPFSVVLLDIDDFKQINDLHGHQAGDDALRLVADALRRDVRGRDEVFRIGGEEFCAVLPGLEHAGAFRVAERLRTSVSRIVAELPINVSAGLASFPLDSARRDEILGHADAALYASKRAGKNRTSLAGAAQRPGAAMADRRVQLDMLHERDPATVVHSVWAANLAVEIARQLGLPDERLDVLRAAAKLHDLGKIAVPDAILTKPGPLDDEERRMVQTHPLVGAELLRAWGLPEAARFVQEHHENVDGSGYPAGLRGDEIALESRIIRVADTFVAMTLGRPYCPPLSRTVALAELLDHRGGQFDAGVVDALVELERSREPVHA